MLTVAYLANRFPCAVEPYVGDEIEELRRRGVLVIAGSVRRAEPAPDVVLMPVSMIVLLRAAWLCVRERKRLSGLLLRVLFHGREGIWARVKALIHTWLGACYAVRLRDRQIDHIHVHHIHAHHGYFGSWIAMVAARLLGVGYSMTLHGSDLLLNGAYLDVKLSGCQFCLTVSEYNRRYILEHYPKVQPRKVIVSRLGAKISERVSVSQQPHAGPFSLLGVGRLHAVKDHAFLIRACGRLRDRGERVECSIAGDGPERRRLESLIRKLDLQEQVTLLGHVPREQMDSLYDRADAVVLTSRSEGIPLVLMEAMARGKIVLAPRITGIPELVVAGKTGFLYKPGSLVDFLARLMFIHSLLPAKAASGQPEPRPYILSAARQLDWMRHAAQVQVRHNFDRTKNLHLFGDLFTQRAAPQTESPRHENFVLQQIQLPVQRHRSVPVRSDGSDAVAGARSGAVLDV